MCMLDNNLKWCREELEMTQEELGFVFGVSRKTISGWETASNPIPFNKLIKFCNLYNYSLDFVIGLSRKNNKKVCFQLIIDSYFFHLFFRLNNLKIYYMFCK